MIDWKSTLMQDEFFTKTVCDRCGHELSIRKQSWWNNDTICLTCSEEEMNIKNKLGANQAHELEGCGKIPTMNDKGEIIWG